MATPINDLVSCPHCGTRVAATSAGQCPACRKGLTDAPNPFSDNPYESAETAEAKPKLDGMTIGEKFYSAAVILCIGFLMMSLASFHFIMIPGNDDPEVFYFIVAVMWMNALTLAVTTVCNLYYRSLLIISTTVQLVALFTAIYFIPIAAWGRRLISAANRGSTIGCSAA